jgi:hypothetical protein
MIVRNSKGQFIKGIIPKTAFKTGQSPFNKGKSLSIKHKRSLSKSHIGKKQSQETIAKRVSKLIGKKRTDGFKIKLSESRKGSNGSNWKGGVTLKYKTIRQSLEFRTWRESVFDRDNYTCQKYKTRGGELHPHHIKNFAQYPELRFIISNGITFSKKAHDEFHKKYGRKNNTLEQVIEFINTKI